jgi:hypothetical protein
MIRLDVRRFQPGYQAPPKPTYTDGESLNTANRIMERVDLAAQRFQRFGEGTVHGDQVMIQLDNHEVRNGYVLDGLVFADADKGSLDSLKAEVSKDGETTSEISYEKDHTGKEVYRDSLYGSVTRSRDGALLYDPDGTLQARLY